MAETYSINGVNIASLMTINRVEGGIGAPTVMQEDYLVPGRQGAVATNPWIGPAPITFYGTVIGSTRADFIAKCRALVKALFNEGRPSSLARTLPLPGSTATANATAEVRYVSGLESIEELSHRVGRVAVEFTMLSGTWSDDEYTDTGSKTGSTFSLTVPGETFTPQLLVEFAGGTAQKLTNTTTTEFVELDGVITVGTAAILDVVNFTATQGTANIVDKVKTGELKQGAYWLTLKPGVNRFTFSGGGSVKLKYKGAYL